MGLKVGEDNTFFDQDDEVVQDVGSVRMLLFGSD